MQTEAHKKIQTKQGGPSVSNKAENYTMRVFYLLAIVFVVDGHIQKGHMFEMNGLFRYYSFHLMMFAFGSGYFFKLYGKPVSDVLHRAKKLLLPLYFWNLVYGIGAAALRRFGGFELGEPLSAYTLLLAPLADGEHFVWNLGSWFIFPLFCVQVFYALIHRLSRLWHENEVMTFLLCLIPGCVAVQLCYTGRQDALPLLMLRPMILLPGFAGGMLYRRVLERRDHLPTVPYLIGIVILRALLCARYENLAYLLSDCSYFVCDAFGVYAGAALAIAFYLRISRLLAPYIGKSRLALAISRNTFDLMMHHYMGFFALNGFFLVVHMLGLGAADFSVHSFRTDANYLYVSGNHAEWGVLYLLCGVTLPLLIGQTVRKLGLCVKTRLPACPSRRHKQESDSAP